MSIWSGYIYLSVKKLEKPRESHAVPSGPIGHRDNFLVNIIGNHICLQNRLPWSYGLRPNNLFASLLSGFLANCHLTRLSASGKGDNEVKLGAVHRSPGICFKAYKNIRKSQLGNGMMKTTRPVIAWNGVAYF